MSSLGERMHVWSKTIDPVDFLTDGKGFSLCIYLSVSTFGTRLTICINLSRSLRIPVRSLAYRLCIKTIAAQEEEVGQECFGYDGRRAAASRHEGLHGRRPIKCHRDPTRR